MASMVATAVDLRDEMDETRAAVVTPIRSGAKAKLLVRTLPKECNPMPAQATATGSATPVVLSPKTRKPSATIELVNEEPLETVENPFDDITEEKLQKLTGKVDLSRVTSLQISLDSRRQSVEVIGELLPSLQQLRIQPQSSLDSFRDLGTSLHSLQILWVAHCGILELDGIGALTELQELHLQHNAVSDISPLTMHDELRFVDLESNRIADVGQIEQLVYCPQLTSLTLRGNPLCRLSQYRRIVANFLPQLETLDGQPISPEDRAKLSDETVDSAIQRLKDELDAEAAAAARPHSARPESSHGRRPEDSTASSLESGGRDDYGSTLTHGTDIVFAGNVTSALRRHRSETEGGGDTLANAATGATGTIRYPIIERPQTPARESITATLDRANELEKHKSRDAILHELKAWRLEAAGSANVGVVSMDDPTQIISPSSSPTKRPPSSGGSGLARVPTAERRPNTSAGVVRSAAGVREAFVDSASTSTQKACASDPSVVKRRFSSSPPSSSAPVPSIIVPMSSSQNVDILILDEEPQHDDDQLPCSPRKTSRGVFTTSTRVGGDWNLVEIAPKLDLESTASFLRRASSRHYVMVGEQEDDAESASSDSDGDSDMRQVARQLKQRKPTPSAKPPTHTHPSKGFFNVAESLHAIDRWREQMDDDSSAGSSSPKPPAARRKSAEPPTASSDGPKDGVACRTPDDTIIQWMKEKHAAVAEIKTRDGFRRFFRGIDEPRLTRILQRVFADAEKVRRRLQLMQGFFGEQE